ncbi:MAG TPA: two-component regulator propeller domain-containing protein [Cyclobacteriaceae bacterium]|nr:two-component regulator propeller domain-containing protein [Cyclobacteriaceae bacterium]
MKTFIQSGIFCLLILFSVTQNSIAQNESLRFEQIGIEEGLAFITAILQDRKGFLWVGTFDGLYKYDGYSFTKYQYDPFDPNSLSQNFIYTIFEDKAGTIWTSTYEGLCKFDRSTEKFIRYKPSPEAMFSNPNIFSINEDNDEMMWVGSTSGELCRFDRKTGKFLDESFDLDFERLPGDTTVSVGAINCIYKDRSGTLWVGNATGLHALKLTGAKAGQPSAVSITHYRHDQFNPNSLSSNVVGSVIEDKAGIIWVATDNGLNSFDRKTGIFIRYRHDPENSRSISSNFLVFWPRTGLKEDHEGNLWIGTDKGLNKLNRDRTVFTAYFNNSTGANSISSDIIMSLEIDLAGILWAGAWSGKLNKADLNKKAFGLIRHDQDNINSLSNNEVTAIVEDAAGIIWISTFGGGLNRWDKKANQFTHYKHDLNNPGTLKNDSLGALLEDRDGQLWVGNGAVLSKLNKQTGEFTHYNSNARNYEGELRWILSITEDRQGLLWLGTGNGIKSFDKKSGDFEHYYYSPADTNGISDRTAIKVFADSKDNIWIGYGSMATDKLDKRTGRFTHYKHDPHDSTSISSNIVFSFYEDPTGNIWMGTSAGGLCYFDYQKEKFIAYTNKHGLSGNSVYSILNDNKNNLWLGTGNGLSRFDPVTKNFTNYDYKDGLQSNVFFAGERDRGAAFKGMDGTLYFGGNNGFNFFDPLKIKADSTIAPIVITQFKLFDKLIKGANESKEIVLDYDQNYFSFEFSSLSFYNPSKNQYAYKLEGFDKDWVYSGSRRYAAYTYVDPGKYTFKVKGTNNDGVWNETGTYIIVKISPPWWHTWWAYTGYALLAIGILTGARRAIVQRERLKSNLKLEQIEREKEHIKLEKAQEVDKAKTAFFTNISHEFRTPLTLIKGPAQNLLAEFSSRPGVKKQVKLIQHNADLLLKLVTQLLDLAKLESGTVEVNAVKVDLNAFLNMIVDSFSSHAKEKEIALYFNLPEIRYDVSIDKDKVETIITNLLGNALKFTSSEGRVDVNAKVNVADSPNVGQLVIRVSDTGVGIPGEDQTKIFERFYQINEGGAHKELGSGVGLALVKELTELLGGKVTVNSEFGKGSEFCVILPVQIKGVVEEVESLEEKEIANLRPDVNGIRGDGKTKLLVVEDNAELRSFIISSLIGDYSFCEAGDGKEAIEIALQEAPDLIISDIMMPEMDGITMTAKLKNDIRTSHIPIILLTAKATDEAKITGLNKGADDYLVKPFNNDELILKVRNMIESRARVREKVKLEFLRGGPTVAAISADEKLLQKVREAILNRLSDGQLSVDSLAEEIGLSRAHFYRKITALTGLPVNELIQSFRLERAAQLLARQWGSVSQVAYEVGFSNPSYFSKRFKEKFGVLPSEYSAKYPVH